MKSKKSWPITFHHCPFTMNMIIYLSFITAAISYTITETKMFEPIREWIKRRNSLLGKLTSCGYCFGFWIALALVAIYKPELFDSWWFLDYLLTAIVIAWCLSMGFNVLADRKSWKVNEIKF